MPAQQSARANKALTSLYKQKSPSSTNKSSMIDAIKLKLQSDHPSSRSGRGSSVTSANHQPLMKVVDKLAGYSQEELDECRQVFNMFDTGILAQVVHVWASNLCDKHGARICQEPTMRFVDHSGAIGLDELENAMKNLGLDPSHEDLEQIIDEVDQIGNHEIDFDEFCDVMRRLTAKKSTWNEVIKECFVVFDRSESGLISKKDFRLVLREFGDITDNSIIDEIFAEVDVDGNGLIDYDEFTYMVRDYMPDDDIN